MADKTILVERSRCNKCPFVVYLETQNVASALCGNRGKALNDAWDMLEDCPLREGSITIKRQA